MAAPDLSPQPRPPNHRRRHSRWRDRFIALLVAVLVVPLALVGFGLARFAGDLPEDHADPEDHFKYGSTGGERVSGFPYWIWRALPQVCAEHLPGPGYASLGLIYENGPDGKPHDLPVGMSRRRYQGVERVFLNCAACHTGTMRSAPGRAPLLVLGMPANGFNIMAFEKFFFRCAADPKFTAERVIPEIERQGAVLDLLDRYVIYPLAIALMRDRILQLAGRFDFVWHQHDWGPGRVDTFNAAKVLFNFPLTCKPGAPCIDERELNAPGDFPAIWIQRQKQGMQLHWDGNNNLFQERDKSAAFGTGTTPPTLDLDRVGRVEQWLLDARPPDFRQHFAIDQDLALRGSSTYRAYCAGCHGESGQSFALPAAERRTDCVNPGEPDGALYGPKVGRITRWEDIRTDRRRLDSYTHDLAVNQATLYAGYDWRFCHFRKTQGYANLPLDGLWLRAPYLHNGSVPTLRDLLEPAAKRPVEFYRGNDVYDPQRMGFVSSAASEAGRSYFRYDTRLPGNSNAGHEGRAYGTELPDDEKAALVEFLKTF
jgi:mono/diheme cytochrome c family protein